MYQQNTCIGLFSYLGTTSDLSLGQDMARSIVMARQELQSTHNARNSDAIAGASVKTRRDV